jgi:RsiW-degrading membrane proteinase PrsW (M82 family)
MQETPSAGHAPRWFAPRWLMAWALVIGLAGLTLLVAQLSGNWTIVPTALFLGAVSGPFAFAVWVTDRTRAGRSVAPDVLFLMWLFGGGIAIVVVGLFESDFFYDPADKGYLWVSLVEETAKIIAPLAVCTLVPKYRSVPQALAFAIVAAGGFAIFESATYALAAFDESISAAREVLFERSLITPFGHLPWTGLAVVVAAKEWHAAGRIRLTPKALWGLGAAIMLHTGWNVALVEKGWWYVFAPVTAVLTIGMFWRVTKDVYYEGAYVIPAEHSVSLRRPRRDVSGSR